MLTGNNGILKKTIEAKEKTEFASEKESLQLKILEAQMENKAPNIGTTLYDKSIENGNRTYHSSIWNECTRICCIY